MKRSNLITGGISIILLTVFFILITPVFTSKAGALSAAYLYTSRIQTGLNGTSPNTVEYVLAIDTAQTIASGGTVTIYFPDADDATWCRTAGALTVTAIASSAADYATTNWAIDSAMPTSGTLSAVCAQGSGTSSVDKITISNVGTLTAGTTYGVKLANGSAAGVIGTASSAGEHDVTIEAKNGTAIDSSTFGLYLVASDTVVVSATVAAVPSVTCSISTSAVSLGTLYPGGSYTTATHTISTTTSTTTSGYYWAAYGTGDGSTDAGLYKSTATTYLIPSTGSGTISLTGVNAEGFGMTVSDPDAGGSAAVPSDFSDATAGTFGALDRTTAGAQLILYQNGNQTTAENATITYGARASTAAQAGSYSESVIFVCGGYY